MDKIKQIAKRLFFMLFFLTVSSWLPALCDYKPNSLFTKDCKKESKEFAVKQVFDGDTISVEMPRRGVSTNALQKIRLLGIDAYEYDQSLGKIAKEYLTMLVLNKNVCVETDVQEKDIYNRTLGYVFLEDVIASEAKQSHKPNNDSEIAKPVPSRARDLLAMTNTPSLFVNEELLKSGHAILSNFPPNIKYIDRLKSAQIYARQNMLGIWEKQDFIKETPAQWRKKTKY